MSRNNHISHIRVPDFANLETGTNGYSVHITLNITEPIANYIKKKGFSNVETFFWNRRWHVRVNKLYTYKTPIEEALYTNAYKTLDHLKILIREAKISILKEEIKSISMPYKDNY